MQFCACNRVFAFTASKIKNDTMVGCAVTPLIPFTAPNSRVKFQSLVTSNKMFFKRKVFW